jgi:hypothetical protein
VAGDIPGAVPLASDKGVVLPLSTAIARMQPTQSLRKIQVSKCLRDEISHQEDGFGCSFYLTSRTKLMTSIAAPGRSR